MFLEPRPSHILLSLLLLGLGGGAGGVVGAAGEVAVGVHVGVLAPGSEFVERGQDGAHVFTCTSSPHDVFRLV